MLNSLSQFQAQGWEIRLFWIGFAWKDRQSKIVPHRYKVLPNHSTFNLMKKVFNSVLIESE